MKNRLIALGLLAVMALTSGCSLHLPHGRRHWEAWKQDLHQVHVDFDKIFLNYDERDPDRY